MWSSTQRAAHEQRRRHVVIVGGGISGLAAAERLVHTASPPRVTLLEASPSLGGCIGTEVADGFVVERGPDVFLCTSPVVLDLCARVGIADCVVGTRPGASGAYVLRGGCLVRDANAPRPIYSGGASARRIAAGESPPEFRSLRGGLGTLIGAVAREAARAGADIRTGVVVGHIRVGGDARGARVDLDDGDSLEADAIIIATPARAAAALIGSADASLAGDLRAIPHASLTVVSLGYGPSAARPELDATGYTVPPDEGRPVLACTWSSAKLDGRAPPRHSLFRVFLGGAHFVPRHEHDDATLIGIARRELHDVLGITGAPRMARVIRWVDAMPRYDAAHAARVVRIEERVGRLPGLALAGNAYRGVGIPDCVRSGATAAAQVLDLLDR